jgi:hypothetical protein
VQNYRIYGLNLTANLAIPGLFAIEISPSNELLVEVVLGSLPIWLSKSPKNSGIPPDWYTFKKQSDGTQEVHTLRVWQIEEGKYFYCLYKDGTTFVVDRLGTKIWATWPEDLTLEDTATYLLGPILGFVLRLQGTVCLHASAIVIQDRVAVLLGAAGAGKSTTAAAFAQRGYAILSDDVVALVDQRDTFLVQPSYPRIRLWNSSVEALYGRADVLPRIVPTHPTWDKRYLDLTQTGYQFQQHPLPLAAIYYLNEREDNFTCPHIDPMPIQQQSISLVSNTYTNYLLDKHKRAQEFEILSRLVKYIPIRQITPHVDMVRLPQLLDTVLQDFQSLKVTV